MAELKIEQLLRSEEHTSELQSTGIRIDQDGRAADLPYQRLPDQAF